MKPQGLQGARDSWEAIRESHRDHVPANLALANIYERLYRSEEKSEILTASDQLIEWVLASKDTTSKNRVEALTLKGRNQKTRWRQKFQNLNTVDERRKAAMNQALRESYEAYRQAFYQDLNHFYPGLAALQMGMIFLDLSEGEDGSWKSTFDDDDEADAYRRKLAKNVAALRLLVPASVEAGLQQLNHTDPERVWAEISKADVLFLTEQNEQRVIYRYRDMIPTDKPFAWDAAKGQLQLFAELGVKTALARNVINTIDNHYQEQKSKEVIAASDSQYKEPESTAEKPVPVVLFAGHRVDASGRTEARFPASQENRAKSLIRDALRQLDQDHRFVGLASAAPGADILFHEVCAEFGIPSTLCLPMPLANYARVAFKIGDPAFSSSRSKRKQSSN